MTDVAQNLAACVQFIRRLLNDSRAPEDIPGDLSLSAPLVELHGEILEMRRFLIALAGGDLSSPLRPKGFFCGTLKALQANLMHLTWQTQMIAQGDFSQRVDFMGDFSQAFNTMVITLDETMRSLREKEIELEKINASLLQEIAVRKAAEKALKKSEEQYRLLSITDSLTGLFTRRHLFKLAEEEVNRCRRYHRRMSVIIFDIDFFKKINDTYGHGVGDQVLKEIAVVAKDSLRQVDILGRYGGEEFLIILPETEPEGGEIVAQRLREKIASTPIRSAGEDITVTASFGVSGYMTSKLHSLSAREVLEEIIKQADDALYQAKRLGRNRVVTFQD
jgi:diguanylate cyclase (GGDEF)-like protein